MNLINQWSYSEVIIGSGGLTRTSGGTWVVVS